MNSAIYTSGNTNPLQNVYGTAGSSISTTFDFYGNQKTKVIDYNLELMACNDRISKLEEKIEEMGEYIKELLFVIELNGS